MLQPKVEMPFYAPRWSGWLYRRKKTNSMLMPQWAVALEERVSGRAYDAKASAEMSASLVQALRDQLDRRHLEVPMNSRHFDVPTSSPMLQPSPEVMPSEAAQAAIARSIRGAPHVVRLEGETVLRTAPQGTRDGFLGRWTSGSRN
mmetsp:Transcript_14115/g.25204  ORF Transcript_14115/g.25204 Transcript_14115/m.25204 type:complete len:146 (-) Transcript_14115:179-616(-)